MTKDGMLTIGVEEEYQIIDESGALHSHIDTLLSKAAPKLGDKVKLPNEIAASIPQGVISPAVETADEKAVRLEAERQAREDATAEVDEKYDRR